MSELLIKGADAIAKAIGESRQAIPVLVEQEGLPAWRTDGRGPWKARPASLDQWLADQEKKHAKPKPCQ